MKPFNRRDYTIRECEESLKILRDEIKGIGDKDINNLKLILLSIKPRSYWFKRGCIRSLRKAIKLLEKRKGDDTMPSIEHMRSAISDAYEGEGWKFRCQHMHVNQVIAIYRSLMRRGAFDDPNWRKKSGKSVAGLGGDNGGSCGVAIEGHGVTMEGYEDLEACTDGPRFIPYTGVQLSIFDI